jgi:hypothetical protein
MAHFAQLDSDNRVINTIFIDNSVLLDDEGNESEDLGLAHIQAHHAQPGTTWKQYSIRSNMRGHSAEIGGYYLPETDTYTSYKTHPTWVLTDDNYTWKAPIDPPTGIGTMQTYFWNDVTGNWSVVDMPPPEEKAEEEEETTPE